MKHLLLFCTGLCFSAFVCAQPNVSPLKLKVNLSKNNLFIIYDNREIPAANIQVLDSLVKAVPGKEHLTVEFESTDAEPEKIKSIEAVLKQCNCHIRTRSTKFNKQ